MDRGDERPWAAWLENHQRRLYPEDFRIFDLDPTRPILTTFMAAFLGLVDAAVALQHGLPVKACRPGGRRTWTRTRVAT